MATDDIQFEPAWNPPPAWSERPPRPPQPHLTTRWPNEKLARKALEDALEPYGLILIPEVKLRDPGKIFLYIDYVILCPSSWPHKAIGIEVKRGFDKLQDGLDVIRQVELYRKSIVVDDRVTCVLGEPLEHIFIWPGLNWSDDCSHKAGARAIRLQAGRRNIGSIDVDYVWRYQDRDDWRSAKWVQRVRFSEGQEAYWTSSGFEMLEGYFGAASKHVGDRHRGMRSAE